MDKTALLKSVFVFSGIEDSLLTVLSGQLKESRFSAGAEIFRQSERAEAFFIVDSGEVTITKRLAEDQEKVLAVLGPGSVFGEMAFFSDSPRTANAVCRQDCVLWKIERQAFMQFVHEQPQAGLRILSGLLQVSMDRLDHTSRELATIYQTGKIIASGGDLRTIVAGIRDEALLAIQEADSGAIFLYNIFNEEYDPAAAPAGTAEISPNDPLVAALKNNPAGIISGTEAFSHSFLKGSNSMAAAPMIKDGKLLGFIVLWNASPIAFKNGHLLLLTSICGQMTEAIENLRHQQDERDRRRLHDAKQY